MLKSLIETILILTNTSVTRFVRLALYFSTQASILGIFHIHLLNVGRRQMRECK